MRGEEQLNKMKGFLKLKNNSIIEKCLAQNKTGSVVKLTKGMRDVTPELKDQRKK